MSIPSSGVDAASNFKWGERERSTAHLSAVCSQQWGHNHCLHFGGNGLIGSDR
jgi:hypothetical protein